MKRFVKNALDCFDNRWCRLSQIALVSESTGAVHLTRRDGQTSFINIHLF